MPSARFHSTFELREVHDHELLSDHIQIHYVELHKLQRARPEACADESLLADWVRFFRPADDREREVLAMKDPTFAKAKEVLEELSDDPDVQYWARRREEGEVLYRHELAMTRKAGIREGREEGRREGLDEGRREALISMLLDLLQERFGEVRGNVQDRIRNASADVLRGWSRRVLSATTLQDVFGEEG